MTVASSKACPKCGELIPAEAPQGLCPKCLLREASIATETGKGPPRKAELPNIEELKAAFPHLEILEFIGHGGMGFVYKARQPKLDRFVALKILPQSLASDPTFTERFTREGRVLAKLNHPNIVGVHDFGQANGSFYLLMEFVNGVNLRQAMEAGRFTFAQALAMVPDICEALQYAHTHGILHRDIKPENILLDTNGRVKIADFGIAKLLEDGKSGEALTGTGAAIGTPNYMAPEQIETPAEVDHRADIYSLGVVLYELLTGELPLGKFPPPSEKTPLNPGVDAVVLRALEKQRERRYQSAQEVKTGVERLGTGEQDWNDDEWVLTCLTCGKTGSLRKAGGIRIGAASIGKRTLIRCSQCKRIRWAAIIKGSDLPQLPLENAFVRRLLLTVGIVLLALFGTFALSVAIYLLVGQVAQRKPGQPAADLRRNTKTIELGGGTNQVYVGETKPTYFSIGTAAPLRPEEAFRSTLQYPDGRIEEGGVRRMTWRHYGKPESGSSFSWRLPQSIAPERIAAAAAMLQAWNGATITLSEDKPIKMFSVTNSFGGELIAYLEYTVEEPPTSSDAVVASIRILDASASTGFMPTVGHHGVVTASLDAALPSAHGLECFGSSLAGLEETTRITVSTSKAYKNISCEWRFPTTFAAEDHQEAVRQLEKSTFLLRANEQTPVFGVTNKAGDVMRGYLKLVPPSTTQ